MKGGDENESERKIRLEKVVASKHLRLVVQTVEQRRAKLENDAATKWFSLAMETDEERKARLEKMAATKLQAVHREGRKKKSKTGEDGSYHTVQFGPGDRGRKKIKKKGMDFIWI